MPEDLIEKEQKEQKAFEEWVSKIPGFDISLLEKDADGKYLNPYVRASWHGWGARSLHHA